MPEKMNDVADELRGWRIVLHSGGTGFSGHALLSFAAKAPYEPSDPPAGRLWFTTEMGPITRQCRFSAGIPPSLADAAG